MTINNPAPGVMELRLGSVNRRNTITSPGWANSLFTSINRRVLLRLNEKTLPGAVCLA